MSGHNINISSTFRKRYLGFPHVYCLVTISSTLPKKYLLLPISGQNIKYFSTGIFSIAARCIVTILSTFPQEFLVLLPDVWSQYRVVFHRNISG